MTIDISGIAFALRSDTAQSPHPLKLSHAQQCIAAALGWMRKRLRSAARNSGWISWTRNCSPSFTQPSASAS